MDVEPIAWHLLRKEELQYELRARGLDVDTTLDCSALLLKLKKPDFLLQHPTRQFPQVSVVNELIKSSEMVDSLLESVEDLRVDFSKDRFRRIFHRILHWDLRLKDMVMADIPISDKELVQVQIQRLLAAKNMLLKLKDDAASQTTQFHQLSTGDNQLGGISTQTEASLGDNMFKPPCTSNLNLGTNISFNSSKIPNPIDTVLKPGTILSVNNNEAIMFFFTYFSPFKKFG